MQPSSDRSPCLRTTPTPLSIEPGRCRQLFLQGLLRLEKRSARRFGFAFQRQRLPAPQGRRHHEAIGSVVQPGRSLRQHRERCIGLAHPNRQKKSLERDGALRIEIRRNRRQHFTRRFKIAAQLLVQVATQVFPFFHIAEWVVRWIVVAACIGFPFAMLFSWFYEWTPHSLQLESEIPPNESITGQTGRNSIAGSSPSWLCP